MDIEERLIEIETALSCQEKVIEDLNTEIIRQGKIIDALVVENKNLVQALKENPVKPLSEETPPPHY